MTKQKIIEVRDDLNRLIDALDPGSARFAVARAIEKLDAIIGSLPDEPKEPPTIDARIHQGNEVIVDVLDLTQFATVRVRGPLNRTPTND